MIGHDELVALDLGHERIGHQELAGGVIPADQRLDAHDLVRRQVDLRLVVQDELVAADAVPQIADHREAPCGGILLLHREQREATAGALRVVHRQIGAAQEIVDVVAVHGTSAMPMLMPISTLSPRTTNGSAKARWIFQTTVAAPATIGSGGQEHAELVAAEPRDRIGVAQAGDEALAHELQQHVAVVMAERVVHALEPVEVEHHQRERLAAARRRADRLVRSVGEQHAIREPREVVVHRPVPQCLGVGLLLRLVAQAGDVQPAVAELHLAQTEAHREGPAALAAAEPLDRAIAPDVLGEEILDRQLVARPRRQLEIDHERERLPDTSSSS